MSQGEGKPPQEEVPKVRVTRQQAAKEELDDRENDMATNTSGCSLNPLVDNEKQSDEGEIVPTELSPPSEEELITHTSFRQGQS